MKKILVAEDQAANRELIRELLEMTGCEVVEAGDGAEALVKMRETCPDLILLDIQMPVLDGYAALQEIRDDPDFSGARVLALTAYAMNDDREKILAAGFDGYLTKPIDVKELRAQIHRHLNSTLSSEEAGRK